MRLDLTTLIRLQRFPSLTLDNHAVTSSATDDYNCFAWAYGLHDRRMEPASDDGWWPQGVTNEPTVDAYIELYASIGYEPCDDGSHDDGYEKVAIYAERGEPLHAARQLLNGRWTSKLGTDVDIEHATPGLVEGYYGRVVAFMRRPVRQVDQSSG